MPVYEHTRRTYKSAIDVCLSFAMSFSTEHPSFCDSYLPSRMGEASCLLCLHIYLEPAELNFNFQSGRITVSICEIEDIFLGVSENVGHHCAWSNSLLFLCKFGGATWSQNLIILIPVLALLTLEPRRSISFETTHGAMCGKLVGTEASLLI